MTEELPPVRCHDPSTWRHKDEKIDLPRLLQLIEENGSPVGLDLHGTDLSELNARPETLRPHVASYLIKHGPDATLPWLAEEQGINLRGAHLEYADLHAAHLENADLWRAHLNSAALPHAHLEGAHLPDAHLEYARLSDAHLEHADLSGAHLEHAYVPDAHLEHAELLGAHLEHAYLRDVHLQNAELWDLHLEHAYLFGAHLEEADLSGVHLEYSQLVRAHLENAVLSFAYLHNADLRYAELRGVIWYSAHLDRTRLRRAELESAIGDELAAKGQARHSERFVEGREAYMALKTNFDSIGRYDDASWAYVKEQQMEKAAHFPTTAGHRWIRRSVRRGHRRWLKSRPGRLGRLVRRTILGRFQWACLYVCLFAGLCPREVTQQMARRDEEGSEHEEWISRWRWARNWAYELLTGYGEHWWKPLLWAAAVIATFTGIYAGAGNIASGDGGATHNVLTALTHSIGAFATIGFNTLEPQGWGARLLTALEAMFGIGLFALFVFTLGTRMRRS